METTLLLSLTDLMLAMIMTKKFFGLELEEQLLTEAMLLNLTEATSSVLHTTVLLVSLIIANHYKGLILTHCLTIKTKQKNGFKKKKYS